MTCADGGCDHKNPPGLVLSKCPCLRCGSNLQFCGWCKNCKEQWPVNKVVCKMCGSKDIYWLASKLCLKCSGNDYDI